jgi:signal transduction histidine kinase
MEKLTYSMRTIIRKLVRREMYETIPFEDLISRQRFTLFRIYTYTAFLASIFTAVQVLTTFENTSILSFVLIALGSLIIVNFFLVKKIEKLPVAYTISLATGFLVVHIQGYDAGGVMNSGTMYMCVIILTAFMLLGPKGGKWFTAFAITSVVTLFCLTEFTSYTSYALLKDDQHIIHQDALTTFILALFLVASQSNYLNSAKNVIIERITDQKNQLEINNRKLKEYTLSLEKTNRELDKFASIVSHDLKAPLRAIGNLTGWIEEDAGDMLQGEVKANFEMIKQRVRRMEDLINAILMYSRADRTQSEDVVVDIKKLVEETMDFIGKPDNTEMTVTSTMPVIKSDRVRLSQVFSNLLGNAIKYNDKTDIRIEISSEESSDGWTFTVKDNGPGIEKQYHEKIFVIFQTLNRRDDVESTGVGLAIVKKIIEDQGGKIWVDSEPGNGASFSFFWPKVKQHRDPVLIAAPIIV